MRKLAGLLMFILLLVGCNGNEDGNQIDVDREDLGPVCAVYSACMEKSFISACVMVLDVVSHQKDLNKVSLKFALQSFFTDWLVTISLAQNAKCVISAEADCSQFYSCVNQGTANLECVPPDNHKMDRYCLDDRTLATCAKIGDGSAGLVEISVRCDEIGLSCVEMPLLSGGVWAACAVKSESSASAAEVECSGTVASIHIGEGILSFDCSTEGSGCTAGTYTDIGDIESRSFCTGPLCDDLSFEEYCEGDNLFDCFNGRTVTIGCDETGLSCRTSPQGDGAICTYPLCMPQYMEETCDAGIITYCSYYGDTQISCNGYGFNGCEAGARCIQ